MNLGGRSAPDSRSKHPHHWCTQYSIHPTGSRRPKTALLAVSRSMHWLCLHPHSPFASLTHSRTHSLTRSVVTQQRIINRPGGEGGCNPRPGLGRSHKANGGQKRDLVRRAREGERERERGTGEVWTRSRGRLAGSPNAASQPASRQVSLLPAQQPSYKNVCRLYVWMYVTRPISV